MLGYSLLIKYYLTQNLEEEYRIQNGLNAPLPLTEFSNIEATLGDSQYGSVKGERGKGKGFKYILYPLPLNLFPDHKGTSYCLSEPY